ncbi:MAG: hypothetical protein J2P48_13535 [Alphaproteobacteria bacterium]|nr:hypothetical protein [Alphaproteobacteria bacterium]
MARKVELKTVRIHAANGVESANANLNYGEMLKAILTFGPPQKGLVLDDVIKAVDALKAVEEAIASKADHVTFSEEQYRTLTTKLADFPFAIADQAIAEFGLTVRNAKEITG